LPPPTCSCCEDHGYRRNSSAPPQDERWGCPFCVLCAPSTNDRIAVCSEFRCSNRASAWRMSCLQGRKERAHGLHGVEARPFRHELLQPGNTNPFRVSKRLDFFGRQRSHRDKTQSGRIQMDAASSSFATPRATARPRRRMREAQESRTSASEAVSACQSSGSLAL